MGSCVCVCVCVFIENTGLKNVEENFGSRERSG